MKDFDIKDLSFDNIAVWPLQIKAGFIVICCLLVFALGYWFDISNQRQKLNNARQQELTLRNEFQTKVGQAENLPGYQKQLQQMQLIFAEMVKKLPNSTEIPSLLDEISKIGVSNGLQFHLFKPMPDKDDGFFIEVPIQISVIGNYHQLAQFISQISGLDRIVTWQDFSIEYYKGKDERNKMAEVNEHPLIMNIIAVTYRYSETSNKPDKAKASK